MAGGVAAVQFEGLKMRVVKETHDYGTPPDDAEK